MRRPATDISTDLADTLQQLTDKAHSVLPEAHIWQAGPTTYFPDEHLAVTYIAPVLSSDPSVDDALTALRAAYGRSNVRNIIRNGYVLISIEHPGIAPGPADLAIPVHARATSQLAVGASLQLTIDGTNITAERTTPNLFVLINDTSDRHSAVVRFDSRRGVWEIYGVNDQELGGRVAADDALSGALRHLVDAIHRSATSAA